MWTGPATLSNINVPSHLIAYINVRITLAPHRACTPPLTTAVCTRSCVSLAFPPDPICWRSSCTLEPAIPSRACVDERSPRRPTDGRQEPERGSVDRFSAKPRRASADRAATRQSYEEDCVINRRRGWRVRLVGCLVVGIGVIAARPAAAQSTIFNIPTTDTVAPKKGYFEFDYMPQAPTPDTGTFQIFTPRFVA